ncbi:hypothetical protein NQ314_001345 [Rhamnusium bicolor]|uniref:Uncharacterized protein n=1 Tax=Rhamnusium bicolor TaxID=1586634 RepID=A0AAV8ZV89_9CUCU|nr:hypothetical protein NQ314_001345 [Rhamnusium bicolor]
MQNSHIAFAARPAESGTHTPNSSFVLVCAIDLIYPPKQTVVLKKENKKAEKDSDDELEDEDIKDDLVDDASQSGGDHNSGSGSETQTSVDSHNTKTKRRKNRRLDM